MSRARAAIILAAGQGKRMKSETPKMLHPIGGRALVDWSIALARDLACARTVVVIPPNAPALAERVTSVLGPNSTAIQEIPRGTGDAARSAASVLAEFDGDVVVYFGDTPLIRTETLARMFAARGAGANVVVLAFYADDPTGYGRIILDDAGAFVKNVEHRDADKDELAIHLCNAGALVADAKVLFSLLAQLRNDNAQQEFYLTDIPGMARVAAMKVDAEQLFFLCFDDANFHGGGARHTGDVGEIVFVLGVVVAELCEQLEQHLRVGDERAGVAKVDREFVLAGVAVFDVLHERAGAIGDDAAITRRIVGIERQHHDVRSQRRGRRTCAQASRRE